MSDAAPVVEEEKEYEIIVNTRPKIVPSRTVTYDEIVKLAYPEEPVEGDRFQVMYRRAVGDKSGLLAEGGSVEVRNGTIFDVEQTHRS